MSAALLCVRFGDCVPPVSPMRSTSSARACTLHRSGGPRWPVWWSVVGFTIDLTDHVELRGALVHFTVSVRSSAAAQVVLHNSVEGEGSPKDVTNTWLPVSTVAQLPTTGSATFGIRLDAAGSVEVARPRLSLVGDRYP